MDQFPPNSRKAAGTPRPEPRKLEPVTAAEKAPRKRGLGRRLRETFIGGDARSAGDYVLWGVVIPEMRDMFYSAVDAGFRSLIYGDNKPRGPRGPGVSNGYDNIPRVNYQGMSSSPTQQRHPQTSQNMLSRASRARHDFGELIIPTRVEAEEVLDRMYDIMSKDGFVSVADLYELTGIQSTHTDMKWGWTHLHGARLGRRRQGGYFLDIPEPQPLGR